MFSKKKPEALAFRASSNLIQHLSDMLYSSARMALAELVVNSHDADAKRVDITIKNGVLTIADSGTGMDRDGLEKWCHKGSPVKRGSGTQFSETGRLLIGSKGLGSLASFRLGRKIEMKTTKGGISHTIKLSRDDFEKDRALEDVKFTPVITKGRGHGTTITIRDLDPRMNDQAITLLALRQHFAHNLPATPDFVVYLNGKRCEATAVSARRRIPIKLDLPLNGRIEGELVIAKHPIQEAGVRITVRGRAVGRPVLFGIDAFRGKTIHGVQIARYMTGTVEITGFDPIVRPKRWKEVILSSREGFVEDHERYIEAHMAVSNVVQNIIREEIRRLDKESSKKKNKKVLESMSEAMRQLNQAMKSMPELFEQEQNATGKAKGPKVNQEVPKNNRSDREESDVEREDPVNKPESKSPEPKERSRFEAGPVTIGGRKYTPEVASLGEDMVECVIDDGSARVTVNQDHPNYRYLGDSRIAVPYLFRMLADAVAHKKNVGAKEAYETLDSLFRVAVSTKK